VFLRSLSLRMVVMTGSLVAVGLVAVWLFITAVAVAEIERGFEGRLRGMLDSFSSSLEFSDGKHLMDPIDFDPGFARPGSGVYGHVEWSDRTLAWSPSFWRSALVSTQPWNERRAETLWREQIRPGGPWRVAGRDLLLAGDVGMTHVEVALDHSGTAAEIEGWRRRLAGAIALFGVFFVAVVAMQVTYGLAPLRQLSEVVANIRAGRRGTQPEGLPREVQPLMGEIAALIEQNRATVERARDHVGNLAHGLRTRLAILHNELASGNLAAAREELAAAETMVQHHLARARAAALTGATAEDVAVGTAAQRLADTLERLHQRPLLIEVTGDTEVEVRCERNDLVEMLGNLMENGCKWAASRVEVSIRRDGESVVVAVGDDGPGLAAPEAERVLARGVREDERVPGSGLGLSIVRDLVTLYGGSIELGQSHLGGLEASLTLPVAGV
jgi:signal transduction histidine kinase